MKIHACDGRFSSEWRVARLHLLLGAGKLQFTLSP
jgi:hypothetical protein